MCVRRLWVVEADLLWLLKLNNFGLAIGSETALVASVNLNRPHLMQTLYNDMVRDDKSW